MTTQVTRRPQTVVLPAARPAQGGQGGRCQTAAKHITNAAIEGYLADDPPWATLARLQDVPTTTTPSTMVPCPRRASTPAPETGTIPSSPSSSSTGSSPPSTAPSRTTATTGATTTSSPHERISPTPTPPFPTPPQLAKTRSRPPLQSALPPSRSPPAAQRPPSTGVPSSAQSASSSVGSPPRPLQSLTLSSVLPSQHKPLSLLRSGNLHRVLRPDKESRTYHNTPCFRTRRVSILCARQLWHRLHPSSLADRHW